MTRSIHTKSHIMLHIHHLSEKKSNQYNNSNNSNNSNNDNDNNSICYPFHSMSTYSSTDALPPSTDSSTYSPPVPIIVTVIFLLSFLFGFFVIHLCKWIVDYLTSNNSNSNSNNDNNIGAISPDIVIRASPEPTNKTNGLDPELVRAFPTFYYSTVKDFRREKYGLECAICLGEFVDDDMLRLLTFCCHVFHKECVDLWLDSNKTCPVCRGELDVPRASLDKSPVLARSNSMHEIGMNDQYRSPLRNDVCIEIKEDGKEKIDDAQSSSSNTRENDHTKREGIGRFFRSNSTGHSISRVVGEDDSKYTLRLLDHVKIKIARGHKAAVSCISFRDFMSPLYYTKGALNESFGGDMDKV